MNGTSSPPLPTHRLIVVACERSGTNWHQELLSNHSTAYVLNDFFNPVGAFGLARYNEAGLKAIRSFFRNEALEERSEQLTATIRSDPEKFLSFLGDHAREMGKTVLSLVLFPDHLPQISVRRLLDSERTSIVFLVRNRLERYVSLLKARQLRIWKRRDTSDMRVKVDLRAFLSESRVIDDWYKMTGDWAFASQCPTYFVSYDGHLNRPPEEAYRCLIRVLEPLLPLEIPEKLKATFVKQDRTDDIFRTMQNGSEFKDDLVRHNQLDYALSEPHVLGDRASQEA
ncbi:MAG: sulfotransferase domain-containing protein [Roseibium sp.]|uniref:sulfotransferase domain-containing protein n=1 Tax=Roseibium sp. TaxID=1936156 RepID=UPI002629FC89|nr:sulfotransferase domain-containing protein [Roseibium sp.]MCV0424332.1 sulfotransferase domain-containing protein [Roseibium sp.]